MFVGKYDSLTSNCTNRYRVELVCCTNNNSKHWNCIWPIDESKQLTAAVEYWILSMLPCFANKIIKFNGQKQINVPNSNNNHKSIRHIVHIINMFISNKKNSFFWNWSNSNFYEYHSFAICRHACRMLNIECWMPLLSLSLRSFFIMVS